MIYFAFLAPADRAVANRLIKIDVPEKHHAAGEAMMGVGGTLFSVILGFMVASVMGKYNDAQNCGQQEATCVSSLFLLAN